MKKRKVLRKKSLVNVESKESNKKPLDSKKPEGRGFFSLIFGGFLSGIAREAGAKTFSSPKFTEILEQVADFISNLG